MRRPRAASLAALAWLVFLLLFAEEPWSMGRALTSRPWTPPPYAAAGMLRVVSLNCALATAEAANEVTQFHPDIVFLEESPGLKQSTLLSHKLFGPSRNPVYGPDCTILSRFPLTAQKLSRSQAIYFTLAKLHITPATSIAVCSIRLPPPLARFDLWSPACWSASMAGQKNRRAQLKLAVDELKTGGENGIVGGDFNCPAGDGSLVPLVDELSAVDCFHRSGLGWGNTVINDFPCHRFDQIWSWGKLRAIRVWSYRTVHSDHGMVVADFADPLRG